MTELEQAKRRVDEAAEAARIEQIENDLRLRHNTFAKTEDLVPYRCDAHCNLVGAMGKYLQLLTAGCLLLLLGCSTPRSPGAIEGDINRRIKLSVDHELEQFKLRQQARTKAEQQDRDREYARAEAELHHRLRMNRLRAPHLQRNCCGVRPIDRMIRSR